MMLGWGYVSVTIGCSCGTKLRVEASAAGKVVTCPKCQKKLRVPESTKAAAPVAKTATPVTTPASAANAPANKIVNCPCGKKLKVPATSAGKVVTCPGCKRKLKIPGPAPSPATQPAQPMAAQPVQPMAAQPVQPMAAQPVQPMAAQPVQPMAAQPVQPMAAQPVQPMAPQMPADPFGGQNPYQNVPVVPGMPMAAGPAYQSAPAARKKKSGGVPLVGSRIAIVGLGIMILGMVICTVGLGAKHIGVFNRPVLSDDFKQAIETAQTLHSVMEYSLKIGRTVLVAGIIATTVGSGICIASTGSMMVLAICATISGVAGAILNLICCTIPWFTRSLPYDYLALMVPFSDMKQRWIGTFSLEALVTAQIILMAVFAMFAIRKQKNSSATFSLISIAGAGTYILVVIVISILIELTPSKGLAYTVIGLYWIGQIAVLAGMGFLLASFVKIASSE